MNAPRERALPWVAPFATFMLLLGIMPSLGVPQPWDAALRLVLPAAVLLVVSRAQLAALRLRAPVASVALGLATWALWIAPETLVPGWRAHWLFSNAVTGGVQLTIDPAAYTDPLLVTLRVTRAALLVPIVEELFWRGWLPRWLVRSDTTAVPIGRFTPFAFVASAVLFGIEHGAYWEVGVACGLLWNWWLRRTGSLGDLVLVHAVTNGALAAWVLRTGEYGYWM